jgi:hypothetical protein
MANANGLKKLRAKTDPKGPSYSCGNCGCKRYSPCGCMKKAGYEEPVKEQAS